MHNKSWRLVVLLDQGVAGFRIQDGMTGVIFLGRPGVVGRRFATNAQVRESRLQPMAVGNYFEAGSSDISPAGFFDTTQKKPRMASVTKPKPAGRAVFEFGLFHNEQTLPDKRRRTRAILMLRLADADPVRGGSGSSLSCQRGVIIARKSIPSAPGSAN